MDGGHDVRHQGLHLLGGVIPQGHQVIIDSNLPDDEQRPRYDPSSVVYYYKMDDDEDDGPMVKR